MQLFTVPVSPLTQTLFAKGCVLSQWHPTVSCPQCIPSKLWLCQSNRKSFQWSTLEYPKSQILTSGLALPSSNVFSSLMSRFAIPWQKKHRYSSSHCFPQRCGKHCPRCTEFDMVHLLTLSGIITRLTRSASREHCNTLGEDLGDSEEQCQGRRAHMKVAISCICAVEPMLFLTVPKQQFFLVYWSTEIWHTPFCGSNL